MRAFGDVAGRVVLGGSFLSQEGIKRTDVLVIGGGINGAGIARDLAGRGLSVILCEKNDLASATSATSSKMIHGGLRYLEHLRFGLVRASLREREVLLKSAPHIIWPLGFVLPHGPYGRPKWLVRLGLFLYDYLGGRKVLPASKGRVLTGTVAGEPLRRIYEYGFNYADCWVEDTRLVVLNAMDAFERGADVLTRVECTAIARADDGTGWVVTLRDNLSGEEGRVHARVLVNASGPWVAQTLSMAAEVESRRHVRHVKGSHIIVPRMYNGEHAYILQNDDKRVVFVLPYEGKYSLIGTTDVEYDGDLDDVRIEMEEVEYLCDAVNRYFRKDIGPQDVVWAFSGVRPLLDDGKGAASKVTRDYVLDMQGGTEAPLLSVYGGKITTYRRLSEKTGDKIVKLLGRGGKAWTEKAALPGAEMMPSFDSFYKTFRREFSWLPEQSSLRIARLYGTRARDMMRGFKRLSDMGTHLGDGVYEAEIIYLVNAEWAMTAEDVLWRRSKLGLHVSAATEQNIKAFLVSLLSHSAA